MHYRAFQKPLKRDRLPGTTLIAVNTFFEKAPQKLVIYRETCLPITRIVKNDANKQIVKTEQKHKTIEAA